MRKEEFVFGGIKVLNYGERYEEIVIEWEFADAAIAIIFGWSWNEL